MRPEYSRYTIPLRRLRGLLGTSWGQDDLAMRGDKEKVFRDDLGAVNLVSASSRHFEIPLLFA